MQRASYQRRKSEGRTSASGCSFWPTPTFKGTGNRACVQLSPERGLEFKNDLNQVGSQIGLWNAAKAWTLMWDMLTAAGWTPQRLFPPMPGDLAEWGETLRRHPELKPSLQRLDDGVATWLDRSAAAGNGVVPMAAARAWRMMRGELV